MFAGVDWASEEHAVCVNDADGRIIEGRRYRHDERGIKALCARLISLGIELVALERPDGRASDMDPIARWIDEGVEAAKREDEVTINRIATEVSEFTAAFPIPGLLV
jgi:hypothetical protein